MANVAASGKLAPESLAGGPAASPAGQTGWFLFQGAQAPYFLLVSIYIFAPYFTTVVAGDPVRGQALWGWVVTVSAVIVAVISPVLGAIADAGGRRKPWIIAFTLIGIPFMCGLYLAEPAMANLWPVFLCLVGAGVALEFASVFYNAMLPFVATRDNVGRLSGAALAAANVGGILVFVVFLLVINPAFFGWDRPALFGLDVAAHEPERITGFIGAAWLLILALPLFLLTPDTRASGLGAMEAARTGLANLKNTLVKLRQFRNVALYLIARMIFNDGWIIGLFYGGIYAAGIFGWDAATLLLYGIIMSFVAALGGALGGVLDDRLGSKRALMLCLWGGIVSSIFILSMTPTEIFYFFPVQPVTGAGTFGTLPEQLYILSVIFGAIFITAGIASARTMMARISPPEMMTEFFGLFALSGNATAFLGSATYAGVTLATGSTRLGFASSLLFLLVGAILLSFVKEERAEALH
ncbi:MFS transporter [Zavarzinia sp. CC-PAN008]|uniref:MFS transporter n=1 Tax=Zavarzinia sp. CC-PAN008 TaxID=3243332 RepID=UPI003F74547E